MALYVAGVSVECLLRAFKGLRNESFDEKHDLRKLLQASRLLHFQGEEFSPPSISADELHQYQKEMQAAVSTVFFHWANDFRYATEDRLRAHLKKEALFRHGLKGDILKAVCRKVLDAAEKFMARGSLLWMRLKKK